MSTIICQQVKLRLAISGDIVGSEEMECKSDMRLEDLVNSLLNSYCNRVGITMRNYQWKAANKNEVIDQNLGCTQLEKIDGIYTLLVQCKQWGNADDSNVSTITDSDISTTHSPSKHVPQSPSSPLTVASSTPIRTHLQNFYDPQSPISFTLSPVTPNDSPIPYSNRDDKGVDDFSALILSGTLSDAAKVGEELIKYVPQSEGDSFAKVNQICSTLIRATNLNEGQISLELNANNLLSNHVSITHLGAAGGDSISSKGFVEIANQKQIARSGPIDGVFEDDFDKSNNCWEIIAKIGIALGTGVLLSALLVLVVPTYPFVAALIIGSTLTVAYTSMLLLAQEQPSLI